MPDVFFSAVSALPTPQWSCLLCCPLPIYFLHCCQMTLLRHRSKHVIHFYSRLFIDSLQFWGPSSSWSVTYEHKHLSITSTSVQRGCTLAFVFKHFLPPTELSFFVSLLKTKEWPLIYHMKSKRLIFFNWINMMSQHKYYLCQGKMRSQRGSVAYSSLPTPRLSFVLAARTCLWNGAKNGTANAGALVGKGKMWLSKPWPNY